MASSVGDSETVCLLRRRHLLALDDAVRHVDTLISVLGGLLSCCALDAFFALVRPGAGLSPRVLVQFMACME